jgi:SAM-dependent methyltransferase
VCRSSPDAPILSLKEKIVMPNRRHFLAGSAATVFAGAVASAADKAAAPTPTGSFWEPLDRQMINWLGIKPDQVVLDAGCGRGDHLGLFAEAAATVKGLDLKSESLDVAQARLKAHPHASRITFHEGDVLAPPFKAGSFDLVWASHLLHILKDPAAGAKSLTGTLKKGGRLVVRENHLGSTTILPLDTGVGRPGLECRIQSVFADWFVDDRLKRGRVPYGWAEVLHKAGLKDVRTKSFLFEAAPPFTANQETYLRERLKRNMEWGDKLSADDRKTLEIITDPKSEHYAIKRSDLNVVSVSTIYIGTV